MEIRSNKVYYFKFSKLADVDNTEKEFEHPFYNDISNCINQEENKYVGFTDNDDIFVRLNDYKVSMIAEVFNKHGFEFEILDVTEPVIKGDIQKKYPEVEVLTPHLFEDFRYDNTTIDDVLDKINKKGIDSLDEIDKEILKS